MEKQWGPMIESILEIVRAIAEMSTTCKSINLCVPLYHPINTLKQIGNINLVHLAIFYLAVAKVIWKWDALLQVSNKLMSFDKEKLWI